MKAALDRRFQKIDRNLHQLLEELSQYDNETLNRKPANGGWSALQVMHHLLLAEEASLKYLRKKLSFDPKLQRAGLGSYMRSSLLNLYFNLPFKFKAPEIVSEAVMPETSDFKEVAERWRSSRAALRQFMEGLPKDVFQKSVYRHPFAGRLSLGGMLRFFDGHFQRHQKQIWRTLGEVS